MIKKNIITKKILISSLIAILMFVSLFAYYVNTNKVLFHDKISDGYGGFVSSRNSSDFINDGCGTGTILDVATGLCWQKKIGTIGLKNWNDAFNYCDNLNLGGHPNWHLPKVSEFHTILDKSYSGGCYLALNEKFGFQNAQKTYYWTSSDSKSGSNRAIRVYFYYGSEPYADKTASAQVMCVRNNN